MQEAPPIKRRGPFMLSVLLLRDYPAGRNLQNNVNLQLSDRDLHFKCARTKSADRRPRRTYEQPEVEPHSMQR
jgi:hypothetical protein